MYTFHIMDDSWLANSKILILRMCLIISSCLVPPKIR